MTIITSSEQETIAFGKKIASNLLGGTTIALLGDLGAGKTCLVKGLAQGLGIKNIINSPTFVLLKVYPVKKNKTIKKLVHVDAYRLQNIKNWQAVGLEEFINSPDAVVVIEWAEKVKKLLPKNTLFVNLSHLTNNKRRIKIS